MRIKRETMAQVLSFFTVHIIETTCPGLSDRMLIILARASFWWNSA